MTPTFGDRMSMFRRGFEDHDFLGWTHESCGWFEMGGLVRRLYMGDGLAVNAHEDDYFGNDLDALSVSGRGVDIMMDVLNSDVVFSECGFSMRSRLYGTELGFHPEGPGTEITPAGDITDHTGWDVAEAARLRDLVYRNDPSAVSDDLVIRLDDTLSISVDRETLGRIESPLADVDYRRGALSVRFRGSLGRAREGVAVTCGYDAVMVMNNVVEEYKSRYGLNYSVLATPAEGLSGRFTRLDRKRYGVIPGVTDREYYTNSFHIQVYYPIYAFD